MKASKKLFILSAICFLALSTQALQVKLDLGDGKLTTAELRTSQDEDGGPNIQSGVIKLSDVTLVEHGSQLFISAKTADIVKIELGRRVCAAFNKRLIARSVTHTFGAGRVGSSGTVELKLNPKNNEFYGFLVDEYVIMDDISCQN